MTFEHQTQQLHNFTTNLQHTNNHFPLHQSSCLTTSPLVRHPILPPSSLRQPLLTQFQSTTVSVRTASPTSASAPAVRHLHLPSTKYNKVLTSSSEFAGGKVDPVEAGKKGGVTGGETGGSSSGGDSSSSGGSGNGQFAGGKVDPVEAGRKGGQSSH